MSRYIYLGDLGDSWELTMEEAIARLPDGHEYTAVGWDGAWAEPVGWDEPADPSPIYDEDR